MKIDYQMIGKNEPSTQLLAALLTKESEGPTNPPKKKEEGNQAVTTKKMRTSGLK